MGSTKRPQNDLTKAQLRAEALKARMMGASYGHIADTLQISKATAWKYCKQEVARLEKEGDETADEIIRIELIRYDAMILAAWPKVQAGDLQAMAQVLAISRERRKLLGLDKPQKIAQTDPEGEKPYEPISDQERLVRIAAILDAAAEERARQALLRAAESETTTD